MKEFANCVAIKCNQYEKDDIKSLMNSVGYTFHMDCSSGDKCWLITYEDGRYAFHSHSGDESNLILDHHNKPLIRDIVSVCSNETWQMDEPKASANRYLGITGANSLYRHSTVVSECPSFRRPTVAEICNHYGYHLEGNNIVKNVAVTTLEERVTKLEQAVCKCDDNCCKPAPNFFIDYVGNIVYHGDGYFYLYKNPSLGFNILRGSFNDDKSYRCAEDSVYVRFKYKSDAEAYVRKNKPFEPVDVVITCNSPEELRGLWVALDVSDQTVRDSNAARASEIGAFTTDTYKWWNVVDKLLIKLNLKK